MRTLLLVPLISVTSIAALSSFGVRPTNPGFFKEPAVPPPIKPVLRTPPPQATASATVKPGLVRSPRFALPTMPTHLALPALSYAGLAATTVGTLKLVLPAVNLAWQGYALVGWSIGVPVLVTLGQLAVLGGSGVAKMMGGAESTDARLNDLARKAAAAVGVPEPKVYEVKSDEPNAFAASGLTGKDTIVAVTSGIRQVLTEAELGAVLAHEMGHLKHRDVVRNMHVAAAVAGFGGIYTTGRFILDASSRDRKRSSRRDKDKDDEGGGAALGLALMGAGLATQAAAHFIRMSASRGAELKADHAAAEAFGAQALIDALTKIDQAAARRPADLRKNQGKKGLAFKAFSHAMISDGPTAPKLRKKGGFRAFLGKIGAALRTHPSLDQRVAALEKAADEGRVPRRVEGGLVASDAMNGYWW